jgi:cytochrome c biogenesis protein CcdA
MIYIKSILAGAVTSVVSVMLFGLLPAVVMGIINSSEDGAWIVDHTTVAIVATLGFVVGFTSMFRRSSRKFPTQF